MIQIEQYQDKYRDEIIELIVNIQRNEFEVRITAEEQPDLKMIREFYQKNNGNFWVAISDNNVIGTISILDVGRRNGALRKMFVKKDYRGAQYCVGQKLLETVLSWCRKRNFRSIYLGTTVKYLAAHRFYEKNGFVEISVNDLPREFPIMETDTKFYTFTLKP